MAVAGGYYADATGNGAAPYAVDDGTAIVTGIYSAGEICTCTHNKSHNFQLILGLNYAYIFPA